MKVFIPKSSIPFLTLGEIELVETETEIGVEIQIITAPFTEIIIINNELFV